MHINRLILAAALSVSATLALVPTEGAAAPKKAVTQTVSWDGTWSGKWGGKAAGQIRIKGNKVVAYFFRGRPQNVGTTKVSRNTIRFGSDYTVTLTMTGDDTASALYRGDGTAKANMRR